MKLLLTAKFKDMKKVILALSFFTFFLFGAVAVQLVTAATMGVEIVDFDKDPTKDEDKKEAKAKKAEKSETTVTESSERGCCAEKSNCCKSAEKASKSDCRKECPDKK